MRTTTTTQQVRLDLPSRATRTRTRVQVKDDSGTWQTWTDLHNSDIVKSVSVKASIDNPMRTGSIEVWSRRYQDNLSPFVSGSRWDGYLDVWREVKIEVAVIPNDDSYTVDSGEWVEILHGRISEYDLGDPGDTTRIPVRDKIGAELMDDWVTEAKRYSTDGTDDVEDVCQQIINDFGKSSTPTIKVVDASGLGVNDHQVKKGAILQTIRRLTTSTTGFDLRTRWEDADSAWRLVFYEPDRAQSTPDGTISADKYARISRFQLPLRWIRNAVKVRYNDGTTGDAEQPDIQEVVRTEETSPTHDLDGTPVAGSSIDRYGWRYMELSEGGDNDLVSAQAQAVSLANAAISDLAEPTVSLAIELTDLQWQIQLNDLLTCEPDDHRLDSSVDLAVASFEHRLEGDRAITKLQVQGQPKAAQNYWLNWEVGPGKTQASKNLEISQAAIDVITDQTISGRVQAAWPDERDWSHMMVYHSNTSGFTANSSTLRAVTDTRDFELTDLDPNEDHYVKVKTMDRQLNTSAISAEAQIVPQHIPVTYLEANLRGSFSVNQSSAQTFNDSTPKTVDLVFDNVEHNTGGWFSEANDDFTAPADGVYRVSLTLALPDSQQVGQIRAVLALSGVNSTFRLGPVVEGGGNAAPFSVIATNVALDAGDVLVPKIEILDSSSYSFETDPESTRFEANRTMATASRT